VSTILEDGTIEPQGFFDTYPLNDDVSFDGTWSNYPYFPSGTIAVSNFDGLFLLRSSDWIDSIDPTFEAESSYLTISPNPASKSIQLNGEFAGCNVVIHDMGGRVVIELNSIPAVNGLNLDVRNLAEGIYSVTLLDSDTGAAVASEKLVISH
jgi:hypothetical protein